MSLLRENIWLFVIVFALTILPGRGFSQADPCADPDLACSPANGNCGCPDCNPGGVPIPPCPIDGGLGILVAAGLGLGLKRAYRKSGNI